MDKYEKRRLALRRLADNFGHGGIAKIAQEIGKEPNYVSRMLYPAGKPGRKRIGEDSVEILNEKFPGWLDDDGAAGESAGFMVREPIASYTNDRPPEGYVRLEHLSPTPSMGHGTLIVEPIQIVQYLDVLEQWVRQNVGSTNPNRIKILTGTGNSMAPTIQDKDLVFVDVECHTIETAGIYVLDVAGRFILKKAMILSDGTLIIRSDNVAEYPDEERHDLRRAAETIVVCGKVLAWWTLRKG